MRCACEAHTRDRRKARSGAGPGARREVRRARTVWKTRRLLVDVPLGRSATLLDVVNEPLTAISRVAHVGRISFTLRGEVHP